MIRNLTSFLEETRKRPWATAALFSFLLTAFEALAFGQEYGNFFYRQSFQSVAGVKAIFHFLFSLAVLIFFVCSMLASTFRWKCVYFAVFALALSVEYGFQAALERFTLPSDIENTFYASDSGDKVGAITLFFNWIVLIPLVAFRCLFAFSPSAAAQGWKLFALNLLLIIAGFAMAADFYRTPAPSNAFAAHFNNWTVSALYFAGESAARKPREPVAPLENRAPPNNIVFIIDESIRADHLSVNGYERDTTPTLRGLASGGQLKNWRFAASGATESVGSNRQLLTGITDLPDRENLLDTLPTVFQYARAAGYKTFYFDGQSYADWNGTPADRADFGEILTANDFPGAAAMDLDAAFAEKIREIVGGSRGNFVWVNKRGVHFRYEKNYPPAEQRWTPVDSDINADAPDANHALENNYDNAILYNSERFFRALFSGGLPADTDFIYTSDHGQTLIEGAATHAGDSRNEALVPIFIVSGSERVKNADAGFAASHVNLFPTLLDLMDYPPRLRSYGYAASLLDAKAGDSGERTYFVGNPSGAFGGKKMNFDAENE